MNETINWRPYTESQKASAKAWTRKTAPRNSMVAMAALAAKSAMANDRRIYLVATAYGYSLENSPPPFGQKALVFEKEQYGELQTG